MQRRDAEIILKLSATFLLDQVRLARVLDVVDSLLILAVTQANVEAVMRDPQLQRAYAAYDTPPPDDLRRPISINALAYSLRLPFETVRRRVNKLALIGGLRSTPAGLYVPSTIVFSALHRQVLEAGYQRMLAFGGRVAEMTAGRSPRPTTPREGPAPLRAAARIGSAYVLRFIDVLTARLDDPVDAAIWLEVLRSGTTADQPVRPGAVAKSLRLPAETVRRRLVSLTERDAIQAAGAGYLITRERLADPDFTWIAERNAADVARMLSALAELGEPDLGVGRFDDAMSLAAGG